MVVLDRLSMLREIHMRQVHPWGEVVGLEVGHGMSKMSKGRRRMGSGARVPLW